MEIGYFPRPHVSPTVKHMAVCRASLAAAEVGNRRGRIDGGGRGNRVNHSPFPIPIPHFPVAFLYLSVPSSLVRLTMPARLLTRSRGAFPSLPSLVQPLYLRRASSFAKYDWEDPLNIEQGLDEDERNIRDMAREFCQEKLAPRVVEAYRNESE